VRAALLPTPGNPYLIEHWLRNYERVWKGEVDELRVLVNAQPDQVVREAIREAVERRGAIYMESTDAEHGLALRRLVDSTEADLVMLCEDDCRVRFSGEVAPRFERIERDECDVIGSPRGSMTIGIHNRAAMKFKEPKSAADSPGSHGFGMWPAFVFARRSALLATDQNYGAVSWQPGDRVPGLGYIAKNFECADTFGACALQLRAQCRVEYDVQFKGPDEWAAWLARDMHIPWFHCGSLSSWMFNGKYLHAEPATKWDKKQWGHRFAWWRRVWATTDPAFSEWREQYGAAWEEYRLHMTVHEHNVDEWCPLLDQMVTWDER
jgi:hypothetical protein